MCVNTITESVWRRSTASTAFSPTSVAISTPSQTPATTTSSAAGPIVPDSLLSTWVSFLSTMPCVTPDYDVNL